MNEQIIYNGVDGYTEVENIQGELTKNENGTFSIFKHGNEHTSFDVEKIEPIEVGEDEEWPENIYLTDRYNFYRAI